MIRRPAPTGSGAARPATSGRAATSAGAAPRAGAPRGAAPAVGACSSAAARGAPGGAARTAANRAARARVAVAPDSPAVRAPLARIRRPPFRSCSSARARSTRPPSIQGGVAPGAQPAVTPSKEQKRGGDERFRGHERPLNQKGTRAKNWCIRRGDFSRVDSLPQRVGGAPFVRGRPEARDAGCSVSRPRAHPTGRAPACAARSRRRA